MIEILLFFCKINRCHYHLVKPFFQMHKLSLPVDKYSLLFFVKPVSTLFSPASMLSLSRQPCSALGPLENISSKLFSWRLRHMTQFLEMSQLLHRFNKEIIECIKFWWTMPPTKLTDNAKHGPGFMFYTSNVCWEHLGFIFRWKN